MVLFSKTMPEASKLRESDSKFDLGHFESEILADS